MRGHCLLVWRRPIAWAVVGVLAIGGAVWVHHAFLRPVPQAAGPHEQFLEWVDPGVPMRSVRIARVRRLDCMPVHDTLRFIHGHERKDLWDVSQLRGLVRIGEARHVLNWVRFVDTLSGRSEVRVSADAARIGRAPSVPGDDTSGSPYWTMGELTPEDFRLGGFTEARVSLTNGPYKVDRWVYAPGILEAGHVQHLQETVWPDGRYSFRVAAQRPAPKLRGVRWGELYPLM